jgi:plastocyanin
LDASNGQTLWQFQTGAGADAPAITYEVDGQQYVAIAAGGLSTQTASTNGDMLWVFSLAGNPDRIIAQNAAPPAPPSGPSYAFAGLRKGEIPIENTNAIKIVDYAFSPSRITVTAGTKVSFANTGSQPHNAAGADAGNWDTDMLNQGETATVTFNKPGTYSFVCTPHPFMIGQVIVTGEEVASAPAAVRVEPRTRRAEPAPEHDGRH